jgi:hypothetical protein
MFSWADSWLDVSTESKRLAHNKWFLFMNSVFEFLLKSKNYFQKAMACVKFLMLVIC